MIKLLAFDLDGTLVDSALDIANAANQTLSEYGAPPVPLETVKAHIGEGLRSLMKDLLPHVDTIEHQDQLIARFIEIYYAQMTTTTVLFPGAMEFLKTWTNNDGLIALITNKSESAARILMKHLALDQFDWIRIIGADTLPEKKPSPLGLQTTMQAAGVLPENTVMIGDGTPDMASAVAAGVKSVALEFGYTSMEILNKYNPTASVKSYKELGELIAKWR